MENKTEISVALAAYKGEKFIAEQLASILAELPQNAEVIVSDDCPGGKTEEAVKGFNDGRIKYIAGPGKGVTANFENALNACSGDYIFLADQDDVWLPGKVSTVMQELKNGASLVLHDASVTDSALNIQQESFFAVHGSKSGLAANLLRNSFVGCCMAFDRELLGTVLPFPQKLPMHDWWIALAALKKHKKVVLINTPLIYWRRHEGTVTGKKNSVLTQLRWRAQMAYYLIVK